MAYDHRDAFAVINGVNEKGDLVRTAGPFIGADGFEKATAFAAANGGDVYWGAAGYRDAGDGFGENCKWHASPPDQIAFFTKIHGYDL